MVSLLGLQPATALISGAGSGMGRACAIAFAQAGCTVGLLDKDESALKNTALALESIGIEVSSAVELVAVDITDEEAMRGAVRRIATRWNDLRYMLACAGVTGARGVPPLEPECITNFDMTMNINLRAQFCMAQEAVKFMLQNGTGSTLIRDSLPEGHSSSGLASRSSLVAAERGSIVLWGSYASTRSVPSAPYTVSKHALVGLTKYICNTFGTQGIRCNCIAPGIIDTPLLQMTYEETIRLLNAPGVPMERKVQPHEVADLAMFLCSQRATSITGALIPIDGGWTAR